MTRSPPAELLGALIQRGLLTEEEGVSLALASDPPWLRVRCLEVLWPALSQATRARLTSELQVQQGPVESEPAFHFQWAVLSRLPPKDRPDAALGLLERSRPLWTRPTLPLVPPDEALQHLAGSERGHRVARALLEAMEGYTYASAVTGLSRALAQHLPRELVPEAMARVPLADDLWRPALLAALAQRSSAEQRAEILQLAAAQPPEIRGEALARLTWHLPTELLPRALALARRLEPRAARGPALASLACRLPRPERTSVASEALAASAGEAYSLEKVAVRVPRELLEQAITSVMRVRDPRRPLVLMRLANRVQRPSLFEQALSEAVEQKDEFVLMLLMEHVPRSRLAQAAQAAARITRPNTAWRAFARLARRARSPEREGLFREAVSRARAIVNPRDDDLQEEALCSLAQEAPTALLSEMLEVTPELWDEDLRMRYLALLARRLPSQHLPRVLEHIRALHYVPDSWLSTGLVHVVPDEMLLSAFHSLRARS